MRRSTTAGAPRRSVSLGAGGRNSWHALTPRRPHNVKPLFAQHNEIVCHVQTGGPCEQHQARAAVRAAGRRQFTVLATPSKSCCQGGRALAVHGRSDAKQELLPGRSGAGGPPAEWQPTRPGIQSRMKDMRRAIGWLSACLPVCLPPCLPACQDGGHRRPPLERRPANGGLPAAAELSEVQTTPGTCSVPRVNMFPVGLPVCSSVVQTIPGTCPVTEPPSAVQPAPSAQALCAFSGPASPPHPMPQRRTLPLVGGQQRPYLQLYQAVAPPRAAGPSARKCTRAHPCVHVVNAWRKSGCMRMRTGGGARSRRGCMRRQARERVAHEGSHAQADERAHGGLSGCMREHTGESVWRHEQLHARAHGRKRMAA
eukprot:358041-Chlamydomonas_euryale.AAC.2